MYAPLGCPPSLGLTVNPNPSPASSSGLLRDMAAVANDAAVGFSAAGPIGGAVGAATGLVNSILSLFGGGSDPQKDLERKGRIDAYYALAMQGNPEGLARLQCYAGVETPLMVQLSWGDNNNGDPQCDGYRGKPGQGRAAGSGVAYHYARAKYLEYQARVAAGKVGVGLLTQSNVPPTVAAALSSPLVLVAAGLGLFLLFRRGR